MKTVLSLILAVALSCSAAFATVEAPKPVVKAVQAQSTSVKKAKKVIKKKAVKPAKTVAVEVAK